MKPRFNWRHQYDQKRDEEEGDRAMIMCEDESLTVQSFTPDADINVLAKRFGLGSIPAAPLDPALFRDTTRDPDLHTILDNQRIAKDYFMALPAKMRTKFHNNMEEMWEFVTNPDNAEEAIRLGLLKANTTAEPAPTTTSSATATNAPATTTPPATSGGNTPPEKTPPQQGVSK